MTGQPPGAERQSRNRGWLGWGARQRIDITALCGCRDPPAPGGHPAAPPVLQPRNAWARVRGGRTPVGKPSPTPPNLAQYSDGSFPESPRPAAHRLMCAPVTNSGNRGTLREGAGLSDGGEAHPARWRPGEQNTEGPWKGRGSAARLERRTLPEHPAGRPAPPCPDAPAPGGRTGQGLAAKLSPPGRGSAGGQHSLGPAPRSTPPDGASRGPPATRVPAPALARWVRAVLWGCRTNCMDGNLPGGLVVLR